MRYLGKDMILTTMPVLTEHQEATSLAQYLTILQRQGRIELFTHVPNETYTKSWAAKRRNKVEGVKQGVPDYIIVTKKEVLFIELKRTKRSVTSIEQKEWLLKLKGKTTDTVLAKGYEEAKAFINLKLIAL